MENSKIEWCDHTFNPWIGCAKVSAGCKNCYAENLMDNRYKRVQWGVNGSRSRTGEENWRQPLRWNKEAGKLGIRYRVFCSSLADVFEQRPELVPWRMDLFDLIRATPNLDWLLLTKRPENIRGMWPTQPFGPDRERDEEHFDNVWLGTSVEDQDAANARIPHLLSVANLCKYTFLSCEPLLGPVDLGSLVATDRMNGIDITSIWGAFNPFFMGHAINWVIAGGESGANARPMHPAWARSLRDQCAASGVPFLFKQWGEYTSQVSVTPRQALTEPDIYVNPDGRTGTEAQAIVDGGSWTGMYRVGKHTAGRLLDGEEHNQVPVAHEH